MVKRLVKYRIIQWTFLLLVLPFFAEAQSKGINFEKDLSWQQIKEKAETENKYIFMDCYATWCGPCKFMSEKIFSQGIVGEFMDAHFISVAVQMDKTEKDNDWVRKWYANAKEIQDQYSIESLPTYLFFSPDGTIAHRIVGATGSEPIDFITKAKESLNPEKQYYALVNEYKKHLKDSVFLLNALSRALLTKDNINAAAIADAYFGAISNVYNKGNLELFRHSIRSSKNEVFEFFLHNATGIDSVMKDDDYAEWVLDLIILNEELDILFDRGSQINLAEFTVALGEKYPSLGNKLIERAKDRFQWNIIHYDIKNKYFSVGSPIPDWDGVKDSIKLKYTGFDASKIVADYKQRYFLQKKMWPEYEKAVLHYIKEFEHGFTEGEKNSIAWDIFLNSKNKKLLLSAKRLAKENIEHPNKKIQLDPSYIDTYANILYKLGEKEAAISMERRAVELTQNCKQGELIIKEAPVNLKKMMNGEKTWLED